jgi:hypothetical protein
VLDAFVDVSASRKVFYTARLIELGKVVVDGPVGGIGRTARGRFGVIFLPVIEDGDVLCLALLSLC